MAKVPYSKLGCKVNSDVQVINFNEQNIEVKQYLPIQEKLLLIGRVIDIAHEEDFNYSNPVKRNVYATIEIISAYTNLTFTEKQREDVPKLYDSIHSTGLDKAIFQAIPVEELVAVKEGIETSVESIYQYQHSLLGILEMAKQDFSNVDQEAESVQKKIQDPNTLGLLKEILGRYGSGILSTEQK